MKKQKNPKNKYIRNSFIFILVFIVFFSIDFITKKYFFHSPGVIDKQGIIQYDWKILGIRSYAHSTSSFFSLINVNVPQWIQVVAIFILIFIFAAFALIVKSKFTVISISIIVAGIMGNGIDQMLFYYVRDIFFTPWLDKGTFNFADLSIILGGFLFILSIILSITKKDDVTKKVITKEVKIANTKEEVKNITKKDVIKKVK